MATRARLEREIRNALGAVTAAPRSAYVVRDTSPRVVSRPASVVRDEPLLVGRRPHRWGSGHVQALLFDVGTWTRRRAVRWAVSHGFSAEKVHATARYLRLRQFAPTRGWPKRMKQFGDARLGIRAVIEFEPGRRRW